MICIANYMEFITACIQRGIRPAERETYPGVALLPINYLITSCLSFLVISINKSRKGVTLFLWDNVELI